MPLQIAVVVKQIPQFEAMTLGADGRLVRDGLELELNAYCRRAVAQAVQLVSEHGGDVVAFTLGPPRGHDVLREAIEWGDDHGLTESQIRGVHITDAAFAGSDTLATARALRAALEREGPFDLVLCGRNSVDADTGQVPPELAELLDLPFVTAARYLSIDLDTRTVHARHETDDGFVQLRTSLPAVVSCAERLIDPCKVDPERRAEVGDTRLQVCTAQDLGPGPWGAAGSPTNVGLVRVLEHSRTNVTWPDRSVAEQVAHAFTLLRERGAFETLTMSSSASVGAMPGPHGL